MKLFSAVAVATLLTAPLAAPQAAMANEFSLDLSRIDVNSDQGREQIRNWINETALNHCGPADMPQPLDLVSARQNCQAEVKAQARAAVEQAIERQQSRVTYAPVVATR